MVIIGIDAHERSHTAVIADTVGRQIAVKTRPAGHHSGNGELVQLRIASVLPDCADGHPVTLP